MNHLAPSLFLALQDAAAEAPSFGDQMRSALTDVDFGNLVTAAPEQYRVLGWIVLLPLLGALINGLFGHRLDRRAVYLTGVATVATSFVLSLFAFAALLKAGHVATPEAVTGEGAGEAHATLAQISYNAGDWFRAPAGGGRGLIRFRYVLDHLSAVMLLVVTGVGTIIHVYSTGYMSHDKGYAKFFAFLNLFMFSMLNLILGDNLVLLFVGWEGVGLCSYLLIGFWYTNSQYASAGRKAFIVNRIGDVGVILGMTILAWKFGTFSFGEMRTLAYETDSVAVHELLRRPELGDFLANIGSLGSSGLHDLIYKLVPAFTWGGLACALLFFGATGKSAQLPLYVWLPDAMAGPTPVSALIHAATMVTAGIYLLCRLSFLFGMFPTVMAIVAIIGALTALFAATIALVQNELKKVLAYSTVSQLGFMFMGCGVGAFGAGLFHVYTHAMFKACLFLGAGAVMHACRDKQDLRELGGLRKYLPYTFWTFALATFAIIGTPGFSGFFSKDEILFRALDSHNPAHPWVGKFVFAVGVLAATLTAFYMCRLLFLTFWGEFKGWSLDPAMAGASPTAAAVTNADGTPAHLEREPEGANAYDDEEDDEEHVAGAHHDAHGHAHDDHHDHAHDAHGHGHDDHGHGHGNPWDPPRDNPWNMTGPLVILGFMSVVAGWIGLPKLFTGHEGVLFRWLAPNPEAPHANPVVDWLIGGERARAMGLDEAAQQAAEHAVHSTELISLAFGVMAFAVGTAAAYWVYVVQKGEPARSMAAGASSLYRLVSDKWRVDELYGVLFVRPFRAVSNFFANFVDPWVIDLLITKLPGRLVIWSSVLKRAQTGVVQTYGAVLALGLILLVGWGVLIPRATVAYRADGTRIALQAYGGPGYSYQWDLEGDGTFPNEWTDQTQQNVTCTPTEDVSQPSVFERAVGVQPDQRRICRVGLRVRNAFGITQNVTRTIELPATETQERDQ